MAHGLVAAQQAALDEHGEVVAGARVGADGTAGVPLGHVVGQLAVQHLQVALVPAHDGAAVAQGAVVRELAVLHAELVVPLAMDGAPILGPVVPEHAVHHVHRTLHRVGEETPSAGRRRVVDEGAALDEHAVHPHRSDGPPVGALVVEEVGVADHQAAAVEVDSAPLQSPAGALHGGRLQNQVRRPDASHTPLGVDQGEADDLERLPIVDDQEVLAAVGGQGDETLQQDAPACVETAGGVLGQVDDVAIGEQLRHLRQGAVGGHRPRRREGLGEQQHHRLAASSNSAASHGPAPTVPQARPGSGSTRGGSSSTGASVSSGGSLSSGCSGTGAGVKSQMPRP